MKQGDERNMRLRSLPHLSKITGHTDSIRRGPPQSNARIGRQLPKLIYAFFTSSSSFARRRKAKISQTHKKVCEKKFFFEGEPKNGSDDVRVVWGNTLWGNVRAIKFHVSPVKPATVGMRERGKIWSSPASPFESSFTSLLLLGSVVCYFGARGGGGKNDKLFYY